MSTKEAALPDTKARVLYEQLVNSWNSRDATGFAALFCEDGEMVDFDGSQTAGREEIAAGLRHRFIELPPPSHVALVRSVRSPGPGVVVLRAEIGMVPPQETDIDPSFNAVQTMLAASGPAGWRIFALQTTPARFVGHPERHEALSAELRQALRQRPAGHPIA